MYQRASLIEHNFDQVQTLENKSNVIEKIFNETKIWKTSNDSMFENFNLNLKII